MSSWTKEEIEFLKLTYPINGSSEFSEKYNKTKRQIVSKARYLGLRYNSTIIGNTNCYSYSQFFDCSDPIFCYLLGFIWADGYMAPNKTVVLEIVEKDAIIIKELLDNLHIHYNLQIRPAKKAKDGIFRQLRYSFRFGIDLYRFLENLNYKSKSTYSHQKIIENIPTENLHYWFRGYFDGDGCIYTNKDNKCIQFSICSTYYQDWDFLVKFLLDKIDFKVKIIRRIQKTSSHSVVRATGLNNITKFMNFIYSGIQFGLTRKLDKFVNFNDDQNLLQS